MKKSEFLASAQPLAVKVGDSSLSAEPKQFSTGSVGYYLNGRISVTLPNGAVVKLQVSGSFTAVGSKEWAA